MMDNWYVVDGPQNDVVVSSRVRLARNFKDYPFAPFNKGSAEILAKTKNIVKDISGIVNQNLNFVELNNLDQLTKVSLIEKHLISPELPTKSEAGLILSQDEKISIMVNEEDHLRIQTIFPGFQIDQAWEMANNIDDIIDEKIGYAYNETYGYLTSCTTNVGTGLRASMMVHLPALTITGYVGPVLENASKVSVMVRGLYGEGTDAIGNMYQLSNQITLGISETELIANIKTVVSKIIEQERLAREHLLKDKIGLEDRIYRAYGIVSNARILSSSECNRLLSDIKLGIDLGIIKDIRTSDIKEMMLITQPANLQKHYGENFGTTQRDVARAQVVREMLNNKSEN